VARSSWVRKAFRVVDRGDFVPERCLDFTYDDSPLRSRDESGCVVHLSAHSIYATALESLRPGASFLNTGSASVLTQRSRDAFARAPSRRARARFEGRDARGDGRGGGAGGHARLHRPEGAAGGGVEGVRGARVAHDVTRAQTLLDDAERQANANELRRPAQTLRDAGADALGRPPVEDDADEPVTL